MRDFIKNRLKEDLDYFGTQNSQPESDETKLGVVEDVDKYSTLEMDLRDLISRHQPNFSEYEGDTYGIIDAVQQVMDGMFQKINR